MEIEGICIYRQITILGASSIIILVLKVRMIVC